MPGRVPLQIVFILFQALARLGLSWLCRQCRFQQTISLMVHRAKTDLSSKSCHEVHYNFQSNSSNTFFKGSEMPVDDTFVVPTVGHSVKHMSKEEEAEKGANGGKQGNIQEKESVDLEKGLKPAESSELEESSVRQASGGHELKDDDEEDNGRCRVCHLVFDGGLAVNETIQLGCHCKEDLASAHRNCAEVWFKIKGNRICEICGATAQNIVGAEDTGFMEQWNDAEASNSSEPQTRCWQSLSLCNFFLACMVVTFILLWLFRVTIN
ncbi:hypothetical protein GOP47_0020501 [Adiantum capillus-veneris]|uniref:RING-CH-type domain-containing protein n=1 Tax=Adiantum capillus-veneris TaxID=13818 RepID=A0A9D4U991_ADICA|nr:hypothetical protein GOP47_0020501 [Adiantum capillus-veneris]